MFVCKQELKAIKEGFLTESKLSSKKGPQGQTMVLKVRETSEEDEGLSPERD